MDSFSYKVFRLLGISLHETVGDERLLDGPQLLFYVVESLVDLPRGQRFCAIFVMRSITDLFYHVQELG